jgi:hypothetical protein
MVDRESGGILRRLVDQWNDVTAELPRLHPAAEVKPVDGYAIFQTATSESPDVASFEIRPVVFNFPERGSHRENDELFVVVKGRLSFGRQELMETGRLVVHDFGTQVGYFRRKNHALTHVYGAHYDFALDEVGHPVFHAQMSSFLELSACIVEQYGYDGEAHDSVAGVLRSVRVPTAQLDAFSLFVQICADHLIFSKSGPEEKAAFNSLVAKSMFCQGAAGRVARLSTDEARVCYRAPRWYPAIA